MRRRGERVLDRRASRRSCARRSPAARATSRRSPSCRRRTRARSSASSADTSLRCSEPLLDERDVDRLRPPRTPRRRHASSRRRCAASPSSSTSSTSRRRCGSGGRPRSRRRGAAPPASRRAARCGASRRGASANESNAYAARPSAAGLGWTRSRAPTMMPSVPSEPTKSWSRSGPTAARGAPPVVIGVPSASTTSRPWTMSSIFP